MAKGVKIQIIIHKISGSNLKISPHIFSRFNSIQLKEYFHQFDKYSIKEHFTHNNNSSQSIFRSSINTLLNNCSKRLLLNSAVVAPRSSTCVTSINVCGVSWKFCDCVSLTNSSKCHWLPIRMVVGLTADLLGRGKCWQAVS